MNEELRNNIPAEEQQLYITAKMELEALERKIVVDDDEYQAMVNEMNATEDLEHKERLGYFLEGYISQSEYERVKAENLAWVNEINEKYGLSEKPVLAVNGLRARQQLTRLRGYYRRNGMEELERVDINGLSDEEAIRLYDEYEEKIGSEELKNMLNDDIVSRTSDMVKPTDVSDDDNNTNGSDDGNNEDQKQDEDENTKNEENDKIEEELEKFRQFADEVKKKFEETEFKLVLGDFQELDVNDEIKGLTDEVNQLHDMANFLIADMDAFRLSTTEAQFSMSVTELKQTVKVFKDRLKELKLLQIDKYNARVEATNRLIDELTDEQKEGIEKLSTCDITIHSWKDFNYLNSIDYNKLIEVNEKIKEVKARDGVTPIAEDNILDELEADMKWIESRIVEIGDELTQPITTKEELLRLNDEILNVASRINGFRVKLGENKDKISSEDYNNYLDRLNDAEANLVDLNNQLKQTVIEEKNNEYDQMMRQLNNLDREVTITLNYVNSLQGKVTIEAGSVFEGELETYAARLDDMKKEIEDKYNSSNLQKNQYEELMKKVNEVEQKINQAREIVKDSSMYKDIDVFAYLNGRIDGLEKALEIFEQQIDALPEKIKDKKVRKEIDKVFKELEKEIKLIEANLEHEKENNPEAYEAALNRLNTAKGKLDELGKKYRKKCPLLVKAVKSAKDFYKKHKKLVLLAAGLAAIALLHATVGPILIPAIMHGNMMIAHTSPALAGFANFANNILGGLIGATKTPLTWVLANGIDIGPAVASTSLLKGLAISGIGSAALITPIVLSTKKLVEKMKLADLKQKLVEKTEKLKKTAEEKTKKTKKEKKLTKIIDRRELAIDFIKSGNSLEDYVKEHELTLEEQKTLKKVLSLLVKEEKVKGTSRKRS